MTRYFMLLVVASYSASEDLDRSLLYVAIGAAVFYLFCIWEFTVGIRKSVKRLLRRKP